MKRKMLITIWHKSFAWAIVGGSAVTAGIYCGRPAAAVAGVTAMLLWTAFATFRGAIYTPDPNDTSLSLVRDAARCAPTFWLLCFSPFHYLCFKCGGLRAVWWRCPVKARPARAS